VGELGGLGHSVHLLCSVRGIGLVTARGLLAEIGDFRCFAHPRELMSCLGLTPSERLGVAGRSRRASTVERWKLALRHSLISRMSAQRLLIVSPVRNEGAHIELVVRAVAAQSRLPDLWLVADNGSHDETLMLLRRLEPEVPFMRVLSIPGADGHGRDRLALALEAKAFNRALRDVDLSRFTHIGKLDGDVELPERYFEVLLERFECDPSLGITGGSIVERRPAGAWVPVTAPSSHVHGALKLYSRECFEAVGGIHERLGWDTIDETYARMRGFATIRDRELVVLHHRPAGSADGSLRGNARHGRCAYIARYGVLWVLLRSLKIAVRRDPIGLSGAAFLWGYAQATLAGAPRVEDREFKRYVRSEHRQRIRRALRLEMA
jgi:poly-beta-1,6-N-acetyl-D-glucosamine synthase